MINPMDWADVPEYVERWRTACWPIAGALRKTASVLPTATPVGYYYAPELQSLALYAPLARPADLARVKAAVDRTLPDLRRERLLSRGELSYGGWVKVAYSPALRRLGELLNFFPGEYPGGIPNAPSPLAAMLTSGLLGAGLGWGLGHLGKAVLPQQIGDALPRTGAMLGGLLGATPGALWGLGNVRAGKSLTDPSPFNVAAGSRPLPDDSPEPEGAHESHPLFLLRDSPAGINRWAAPRPHLFGTVKRNSDGGVPSDASESAGEIHAPLHPGIRAFCKAAFGTLGEADLVAPSPLDVPVNALGQTLYQSGADPRLLGTTMGLLYAAQQTPDPAPLEGYARGSQLGQLALGMGKDYTTGLLTGAVLNKLVGTPLAASTYGTGNAVLGIVRSVLPRMFGR